MSEAEKIAKGLTEALVEWALDQASMHHRFAHENERLRSEHIALCSAYNNVADKVPEAVRKVLEAEKEQG